MGRQFRKLFHQNSFPMFDKLEICINFENNLQMKLSFDFFCEQILLKI